MPELALGVWILIFLAGAAVVGWAGVRLADAGEQIARITGLSRLLVGMLLVALATSLPEVVIDVSAVLAGAPDLAVGDLFGSSMANMAILAIVDLIGRQQVWLRADIGVVRLAGVAIALTGAAVLGVLYPGSPALGWVGVETILIVVFYVAALAWMRRSPNSRFVAGEPQAAHQPAPLPHPVPLRTASIRFGLATLLILFAAPAVAFSAEGIAEATGIGQTFVGTTLLAVTTSLPELVASMAAIRIGAHDMAVGNLFGSNAFNMIALFVSDVAYTPGPILDAVESSQAVAGLAAIVLMALAVAAISHGTETRIWRMEPDALAILLLYALSLAAIWQVS